MNEKELELLLKSNMFVDSSPDFDDVWNVFSLKKKEVYMSEKKGGIKLAVWVAAFSILVVFGFIFVSKFSLITKQNKIEKGEALIVTTVVGNVYAKKMESSEWKKVMVEDILQMGDSLRTDKDSYCEIQMVKRGIFRIEPVSEVLLATLVNKNDKVESKFKLEKGGMALKPRKLEKGEVFEVHTASAVAAVRGTKFFVEVDENGDTKVAVSEGKVSIVPNVQAVERAVKEGHINEKTADVLKEKVLKSVEVSAGEEVGLKKEKVEKVDIILEDTIKQVASEKKEDIDVVAKVNEKVVTEIAKTSQKKVDNVIDLLAEKKEISKEKQEKLNLISEDRILEKKDNISKVIVTTVPDKAKVYIDGKEVGITPLEVLLEKGEKVNVKIEKDGYEILSKEFEISADFNINETLKEKMVEVVSSSESSSSIAKIETPKLVSGQIEWEKSLSLDVSEFDYSPVMYKGKIVAVSMDKLYIFDSKGTLIKKIAVKSGVQLTKPAVGGNIIVLGAEDSGVYAYDLNGKLLWKLDKIGGQKFGGHPVIYGDKVIVSSFKDGIFILSQNGEIINNIKLSAQIFSSPLVIEKGKKIIYALENGTLVCYNLDTKSEEWTKSYEDRILYPLIGNDSLVITFDRKSGTLKGYSTVDGTKKWELTVSEIQKTEIEPIMAGRNIILASRDKNSVVKVVSLAGKVVSTLTIRDKITYPYASGNILLVGGMSGKVYAYDIESGKNLWISDGAKGTPISVVIANEEIYGISSKAMLKIVK